MTLSHEAERLLQEVSSAASRSDAEHLIRKLDFSQISADECEELCERLADVINELGENDQ
jgi:hypothetical protein